MSNFLNETYDLFKSQGLSILGEGFKEVATNPQLFDAYSQSLVEGASADSAKQISQLLANSNREMLVESSISGISPIMSLAGPIIRKLWPAFALKNAVSTDIARTPALLIPYTRPYFETADGVRHYIPAAFADGSISDMTDLAGNYLPVTVTLVAGTGVATFDTTVGVGTASSIRKQPLDSESMVESVTVGKTVINVMKKAGVENNVVFDVDQDVVVTSEGADVTAKLKATLLVRFDVRAATAQVVLFDAGTTNEVVKAAIATAVVKLKAHRSTEYNEVATSWSFEIVREDIRIGTGDHYVAPLPIEAIKDMNALYAIDGTKEAVDLMTNGFGLNVETKIFKFLKESFLTQPGHGEFSNYPTAASYLSVFDVKPAAGFAGGPKAWREELKPVIDHLAARIKNQTHLGAGIFAIVGNPLDVQLITNIDWAFKGGADEVDGVTVNYSLGKFYGASYAYKVVSTEVVPQGMLYIVFLPESATQMTYKYWAYTINTELGYRDPNHANVPAIMMTKRDALKSFLPAIAAVKVIGNDGGAGYDPFRDYVPMATVSGLEETVANGGATSVSTALGA